MIALLGLRQASEPSYVREGDRVEAAFRAYREDLAAYHRTLRDALATTLPPEESSALLRLLDDAPPPAGIYGYQILPRIVETPWPGNAPVTTFNYSWPITAGYVAAENVRLAHATARLNSIPQGEGKAPVETLRSLVREYPALLANQRTIDQYIQYNRFWQRVIAGDRARFDGLTKLYYELQSGNPATTESIRQVLGKPDSPDFIDVRRDTNRVTLRVPVYTDIQDERFLEQARLVVEDLWRAREGGMLYTVEVEYRRRGANRIYSRNPPAPGEHIDVAAHVARFPSDGAVLTTGAEFTYAAVGRYIALGPGDLAPRIFAHEFGHLLGFTDGYIRGYRDLGETGFEILELTSFLDDIMSAPRQGHVQVTHFKLVLEGLR